VDDALEELKQQVRKAPANPDLRGFLYQLFLVKGEWDRALSQLDAIGSLDPGRSVELQVTRTAIECERARARVFAKGSPPFVHGPAQKWMSDLLQANIHFAAGRIDQACALRDQALEAAPATPGTLDGTPFQWLSDTDHRLGPVLECFVRGQYMWVPFNTLVSVRIEEPKFIQNTLWANAVVTWSDGSAAAILLPARYPGLPDGRLGPDDLHLLGRATSYEAFGDPETGLVIGVGQKVIASDVDDYPLLAVRTLEFHGTIDPDETRSL
ncbi:MAG: hypothetical protein KDA21_09135, partial [Phycisphaerales bacterium]|nr:hypothetical protein [Phycisphaerales bacterium]